MGSQVPGVDGMSQMTSNADFLLELRSEEIPARMQAAARSTLEALFLAETVSRGLHVGSPEDQHASISVYTTPRRLVLIARDVPLFTETTREETKGPRTSAPEQALEGFLRKTGLAKEQLTERDGVWFAVVEKPGRAAADVLAEAIPPIIRAFPWPKSQRWGAASLAPDSLRWVRPLSGIVALLGDDLIDCEVGGIRSGYATMGHRFHHHGDITIGNADDYAAKLRAAHVIVDHAEREAIVRKGAQKAAAEAGLVLVEDEGLVIENAGLTEWPVPLLGRFDEAFLEVPPEVIQLTARVNQKYFICRDSAGKLANAFVCTANIAAHDGGAMIVAGNRKVLAARLSDARFFWEQDRKTPLSVQAEKLARITFHEKLGSVADKVERVAKLARWLVEEGIVSSSPKRGGGPAQLVEGPVPPSPTVPHHHPADGPPPPSGEELAAQAELAARLCKADLVTEMVGEFPELQGLMGGYYARAEGLPDAVADAIRDHYKPVGQGDDVPTAPVTVAVALADKLDTLAGFFAIDEKPTGSKDPFALRRAALGVIQILLTAQVRCNLSSVFHGAITSVFRSVLDRAVAGDPNFAMYIEKVWKVQPHPSLPAAEFAARMEDFAAELGDFEIKLEPYSELALEFLRTAPAVMGSTPAALVTFFADRLKVQQREAGVRHDLIDAVFALGGEDDLVRVLARVHALQAFVTTEDGTNLLAGYKRAANILKKEGFTYSPLPVGEGYQAEPAEQALVDALDAAEPGAEAAVEAEDFTAAMAALAILRAPIDAFFESVTVNDADPAKRAGRLGLLDRFRAAVHKVADFGRIEG